MHAADPREGNMTKRPTSVAVVAWLMVVFASIGVAAMLILAFTIQTPTMQEIMARSWVPVPIQLAVGWLGTVIMMVCGFALLYRQNWARWLYVGSTLAGLLYNFFSSPYPPVLMIPSVVFFLVAAYFLFVPVAQQYFKREDAPPAPIDKDIPP
jgi:hypothetical protein